MLGAANAHQAASVLRHYVAAHYRLWTPNVQEVYAINVEGTTHLLQAALELGLSKVVYTSSVATLGLPADGSPGDETLSLPVEAAVGHYKRSKILAEERALALCEQGLPLVVVQPSPPVGPWDVKQSSVEEALQQAVHWFRAYGYV